jgi:hypothetical protein
MIVKGVPNNVCLVEGGELHCHERLWSSDVKKLWIRDSDSEGG